SGGVFNGSTHPDYTNYFEVLPSAALERALFLEADRMRAPRITAENLRNQVDVVKEEIRLNVLNRPYGGFPWITLPPVLYDTFPNAHNGYGDFTELDAATVDDCADFFDAYYAPGNAVLTVAGDLDVEATVELVHRHFGDVPARPFPDRPSFAEPPPERERRQCLPDPLAPLPAVAVGYRLPDPVGDLDAYYAPGNAVLTVAGEFDVEAAVALVHRHFGDVPARPFPDRPSFAEPAPERERRQCLPDPLAPLPAVAIGYRLPDPVGDLEAYLAHEVLAAVLSDGDSSRLEQRLVHTDELVTDIGAGCGLVGAPLDARDPDTFTVTAIHPSTVDVQRVLAATDEEIARLARQGPKPDELARITARWAASLFREHDRLTSRSLALGAFELLHGRAELVADLPAMVAAVQPEQVASAAARLRPDSRAVLIIEPSGGSAVLNRTAAGSPVPAQEA
ncbi:MAG: M16 family metallopeptidase, partial [Pseudonocardiaceae bacterium]